MAVLLHSLAAPHFKCRILVSTVANVAIFLYTKLHHHAHSIDGSSSYADSVPHQVAVTDLSPRKPGFTVRLVRVQFLVSKVEQGNVFLRVLYFPPVSVIPLTFHTHSVFHKQHTQSQQLQHR